MSTAPAPLTLPPGARPAVRDVIPLLLRGGPQDRRSQALPVAAFAVVTGLALTVAGGAEFFATVPEPDPSMPVRPLYLGLTAIAVAILAVPLATLGASAVRLSTRRQDTRLASLRLIGAPGGLLRTLAVAESALLATAGALLGVLLHLLMAPVVGHLHFVGRQLGMAGVVPSWPTGLVTLATVVVVAVLAAQLGLRRIAITPLGIRTRQDAPRVPWAALLLGIVVLLASAQAIGPATGLKDEMTVILMVSGCLGAGMLVLNLVGPPVLALATRLTLRDVRGRRGAERLLAARAVLEDPRGAWRQASGVAMVSFLAVVVGVGMALERLGMTRATIERARVRTAMQPIVTVCLLGAGAGTLVTLPLAGYALLTDAVTLLTVAASPVVGLLVARLALATTRPLLTQVLDRTEPVV